MISRLLAQPLNAISFRGDSVTPSDYLKYLLRLIGEDETGSDGDLLGLFQTFRPDGRGAERVFAPLVNGQNFIERILPVYEATASSPAEEAYFVVRREPAGSERTLQLGQALSLSLSELSLQVGDPELIAVCKSPKVTACGVSSDALDSDEHLCVYEILGDWFTDLTEFERPETVLNEAFYSIACNPWLSLYLRWPQFAERVTGDPFASYFALWQAGLDFAFVGNQIHVGPRA